MDTSYKAVMQLVDTLTDKKAVDLDATALQKIKAACKLAGEPVVKLVFELWLERLKENHARVRRFAMDLGNELLVRSSSFRQNVASHFEEVLELAVGFRAGKPLPGPKQEAVQLRERALEFTERWKEDYGELYPQIRMGYNYLRDVLKMRFPELRAQNAARQAAAAARQERTRRINEEKYEHIRQDYIPTLASIQVALEEMNTSLRLLENRPDPLPAAGEDDEWEDVSKETATPRGQAAEHISELGSSATTARDMQQKSVLQPPDPAVLTAVQDAHKLLSNRHLPTVLEWLRVIVKVDMGQPGSPEHGRRERILRAAIKARDNILEATAHYEALMTELQETRKAEPEAHKVSTAAGSASSPYRTPKASVIEDVFGADSDEEGAPAGESQQRVTAAQPPLLDPTFREQPTVASKNVAPAVAAALPLKRKPSEDTVIQSRLPENVKQKLLSEAPTIPAGNHLAYWDSDKASLLNNKGMEVYNHWGAVDEHVPLPEHVISQFFTTRATYYEPQAAKAAEKRLKAEGAPAEQPIQAPSEKQPAPVTAIGFGGVTNSSLLPKLQPSRPARLPVVSKPRTDAHPARPAALATGQKEPQSLLEGSSTARGGTKLSGDGTSRANLAQQHASSSTKQPAGRDRSKHEPGAHPRPLAAARNSHKPERGARGGRSSSAATQKARDSAHNEAILAAAGGSNLAYDPAEREAEAMHAKQMRGRKEQAPVRERLAKKLLSGGATAKAIHDMDAVENENFKERESGRW